jgi:thiosulfate/3-mercaptopyruvate sulfurtransferase
MNAPMHPLVSTADLAARLADPALRVFDCTTFLHPQNDSGRILIETGRRGYLEDGHVPGAALIELQQDLSDPSNGLRFTMPSPDDLARKLKAIGVGDGTQVVLYSAGDAWWATRVWWMLRSVGFDAAAVLDGGLRRWIAEGRPLSREPVRYPAAASLAVHPRPLFTDRDGVLAALRDGSAVVTNCLREEQHRGTAAYHYGRPGHITGSVSAPAAALFEPDGRFAPPERLRAFFADRGIGPDTPVIAYCGGGIAATGDAFALTALLGHREVRVYDNSLQEWATDPSLPMSTD